MPISPQHIRYIKLGDGGRWAEQALKEGTIAFGYHTIPHEICLAGNWDAVWHLLNERKSEGAQTAGTNEVRTFYEMDENCLWITFAEGHLCWAFARAGVLSSLDESGVDPSRTRATVDGWHKTDINNRPLRVGDLSSRLTKVVNFRGTICSVKDEAYLLRRINGIEEPIVSTALQARAAMTRVAIDMIRMLHHADFETLVDLIFARSGWHRSSQLGQTLADIDLALEQPTTGETAFVQVKSRAGQGEVDDYLNRFRNSGYDRFFFVCHSPKGKLSLPAEGGLHLLEGEKLAEAAVKNGLFDWLIERSK